MQKVVSKKTTAIISKWFPSKHGGLEGMKAVERKLSRVDCVIEVHDARAPLSGRNQKFLEKLRIARPHVLVLNKVDRIPRATVPYLKNYILNSETAACKVPLQTKPIFCSALGNYNITKIIPACVKAIRAFIDENIDFAKSEHNIMIIGVPNVGKSSLINAIRQEYTGLKNEAARIGAKPGVTRSVMQTIRVSQSPKVYLVDTPGVLEATPVSYESALRLALCGCTMDHAVGVQLMAAYLFNFMQTHGIVTYCNYMGLDKPTDDFKELLESCATMLHASSKTRIGRKEGGYDIRMNLDVAAAHFVEGFRRGRFGEILLDWEALPKGMPCWKTDGVLFEEKSEDNQGEEPRSTKEQMNLSLEENRGLSTSGSNV